VLAAASREQASVVFRYMTRFAEATADRIAVRHLQLRTPDGGTLKGAPLAGAASARVDTDLGAAA
jgi:hypothetical protein